MSAPETTNDESLARRLDEICDRFETAWKNQRGPRPLLERYLNDANEGERSALMNELLKVELFYRQRAGERPTRQIYVERFPSYPDVIAQVFDNLPEPLKPSSETSSTADWTADQPDPHRGSTAPSLLAPGVEIVPGYPLGKLLGRGGFGEVWQANAPGDVPIALKMLRLTEKSAAIEARALEFMRSIVYPHLLSTFGIWTQGDLLIIGMELAEETLLQRFERARNQGQSGVPADELLEYMREAAKAIDFLNDTKRIIHRDIKPQNLLLVGGGIKVADFGLAHVLERSGSTKTVGLTPAYSAPEFFEGRFCRQSDQYSLAVTYCHLRYGLLPFTGGPVEVMAGHLYRAPALDPLPELERRVVARALAKNAEERWPTCLEFWKRLSDCSEPSRRTIPNRDEVSVDPSLILGPSAKALALPYRSGQPVWVFLADVFNLIAEAVEPYTYGKNWVLRDTATDRVFDVGSPWARSNRVKEDSRQLSDVGIQPGMRLEVVPMMRHR